MLFPALNAMKPYHLRSDGNDTVVEMITTFRKNTTVKTELHFTLVELVIRQIK